VEHSVAVVDPEEYQATRKRLSYISCQQVAYVMDRLRMVVAELVR